MDQRDGNYNRRRQGPPPKRQERSQPYAGSRGQGRSRSRDDDFEYEEVKRPRPQRSGSSRGGKGSQRARSEQGRGKSSLLDGSSGSLRERYDGQPPARGNQAFSQRIVIIIAIIIAILIIIGIARCVGGGDSDSKDKGKETAATEQKAENGTESGAEGGEGAAATGVESPWTETKTFSSGDATFDARLKDYCDQHTPEGGTAEEGAKATYDVIVAMERDIRDNNQNPGGSGWELTYAKQILDANSGNNYEKAALIAQMLKYFGYNAMAQPCIVDGESAGLVFIANDDGTKLICSPALGEAGWMMDERAISYQIDNGSSSSSSSSDSDESSSSSDGESSEYDASSDETTEL